MDEWMDGWMVVGLIEGCKKEGVGEIEIFLHVPIDLVIFKERNGAVAIVGLERGTDPVGGVDALQVATCVQRC